MPSVTKLNHPEVTWCLFDQQYICLCVTCGTRDKEECPRNKKFDISPAYGNGNRYYNPKCSPGKCDDPSLSCPRYRDSGLTLMTTFHDVKNRDHKLRDPDGCWIECQQ